MKETLGFITIALSLIAHAPYITDTIQRKTKPHVFTWVIWTFVTAVVFFGQLAKGGAAGAWSTGITTLLALTITLFAIKNKNTTITQSDKVFFVAAIVAITAWLLTKDPTLSIVIATLIDACAFIPTIRKTLKDPRSETFTTYAINILRHILSLLALGNYSLATLLYPVYLLAMNTLMTGIMLQPKMVKFLRSMNQ